MNFFIFVAVTTSLFSFPQVSIMEPLSLEEPAPTQESIPSIFEKIAYCESKGKHFNEDGLVTRGVNKHDVGKYQINVRYWQEFADKLGHDIYTEEGNEAMALVLYERYGTEPWNSSKKCWSNLDQTG